MQLKKGDVVHVRAVVCDNVPMLGPNVRLSVDGYDVGTSTGLWKRVDIIRVEPPKPLQVGDHVVWGGQQLTGEIKSIDGKKAWVKIVAQTIGSSQIGCHTTQNLDDLVRLS